MPSTGTTFPISLRIGSPSFLLNEPDCMKQSLIARFSSIIYVVSFLPYTSVFKTSISITFYGTTCAILSGLFNHNFLYVSTISSNIFLSSGYLISIISL
jgi:hypothetical protein